MDAARIRRKNKQKGVWTMSARNPIARLAEVNAKADAEDQDRRNFKRFIGDMKEYGQWSDDDVADYTNRIKVLMGNDDSASLALFHEGAYATSDEARQGARTFWKARLSA